MAGVAQAAHPSAALGAGTAAPPSPYVEKPYAVLLLPAVLNGALQKQELFLPMTLAYLLSAHIPFRFPLCENSLAVVERVFDDILNGLPKESKGICYHCVDAPELASVLLPDSSLLLTDERGLQGLANCHHLPLAVISKSEGKTNLLRLRNLERIYDVGLRGKLAGCAQLINLQSGASTSEGHCLLAW
jgi:hypothetical protein